jgi:hypothetical protein
VQNLYLSALQGAFPQGILLSRFRAEPYAEVDDRAEGQGAKAQENRKDALCALRKYLLVHRVLKGPGYCPKNGKAR